MKKAMVCIVCPRGCALTVTENDGNVTVSGNSCPKGEAYGAEELIAPKRTVTTVARVSNRCDTMVSVKTLTPIPKENMLDTVKMLRTIAVQAPIRVGDVIMHGVFGSDVVATKDIM